nr:S1 RNA-binding domain-containing protein [Streptomyces lucensis]
MKSSVSSPSASSSPWTTERVGEVVTGRVTKIAPMGFFVRIAHCVEGLIPFTGAVASPSAHTGQAISVRIVAVDLERARVLLAWEGTSQY